MLHAKNYQNRAVFHGAIQKNKSENFLRHSVHLCCTLCRRLQHVDRGVLFARVQPTSSTFTSQVTISRVSPDFVHVHPGGDLVWRVVTAAVNWRRHTVLCPAVRCFRPHAHIFDPESHGPDWPQPRLLVLSTVVVVVVVVVVEPLR